MTAIDPNLRTTRTTCPYCGVGCGVLATPDGTGAAAIAGDPDHPANLGRLCSKGSALGETLSLESRLLYPMIRCKGALERVAWSDALDHVAHRLQHIIARDGADSVAFYLSGQILTEDYYVANKLMKGFIGSANVDTNSRLCMASTVAGHRRAFGADTVPGCYEDLDEADLLVLVGSNAAWCHPVLFQRMLANRQKRGARMVVIDPRRTDTAEDAELFLGLKPGTDTALFSGLLVHLADNGALDRDYIEQLHLGLRRRAGARQGDRGQRRRDRARDRPHGSRCCDLLRDVPRHRAHRHALFARASTSPRRAPTRSTPFSTAISRRAASARSAPRRSRSPASPTRWAGARSAASPISSPRIWPSRRPTSTGCGGSGRRRASRPMTG